MKRDLILAIPIAVALVFLGVYLGPFGGDEPPLGGGGLELPPIVAVPSDTIPSPIDVVVERLKGEEGYRQFEYLDSRRVRTVGYGTNLAIGLTDAERAYLEPDGGERDFVRIGVTEPEAEWLLRGRVITNGDLFRAAWPAYEDQPFRAQVTLLDMSYQLGVAGLLEFGAFLGLMEAGDYVGAVIEDAMGTLWASQTSDRAQEVLGYLLGGVK